MGVSAPADKRFRRARVSPGRRSGLFRVTWRQGGQAAVIAAILIYVVYRAVSFVIDADAFTVTRIDVSGNEHLSRGEVVARLDGLLGSNMVTVDLDTWRQKLLSSSWVADASIRRVLPGTVAVSISEGQPMGIGRIGDELDLIDDRGSIIGEFGPSFAQLDLPVIDGLTARGGDSKIDEARADLAARVLASLRTRAELAKRVSEIDVSDVRNAAVILKGDTALLRIGNEQFADRLEWYTTVAGALRDHVPAIDDVDLRFPPRVFVTSQKAAAGGRIRATTGRK